jgi:hypothetical protein
MLNWWVIYCDESRYPDLFKFVLEKHLDHKLAAADYIAIGDPYKQDHFTYGARLEVITSPSYSFN